MSERKDLTRWNRAALTRFRYVDGNAVEYLETLRQQLVEQFADPETGLCEWLNPAEKIPANEIKAETETLIQRQQRLGWRRERILDTYHQDRRDWAWEITRTFARACHILTEHTNAYANEGYLGTATQWDNVRRLVEMLDYHPAPPASASTKLVLVAKESKSGLVKKGWQVKYKPPEGGDKVVFETLDDVQVHHELNRLRLEGYDTSPDSMGDVGGSGSAKWSWVTEDNGGIGELELSAGNVAVLLNTDDDRGIAVTLEEVDTETNDITLSGVSDIVSSWTKGATRLLVSPKDIFAPRLGGNDVVQFYQAHGLSEGDVIAWNPSGTWHFDKVIESDALSVKLLVADPIPAHDRDIFKGFRIPRPPEPDSEFMFPYHFSTAFKRSGNGFVELIEDSDYEQVSPTDENGVQVNSHSAILDSGISEIFLVPSSPTPVGTVELQRPFENIIDGGPGDLASGQWVVAEDGTGDYLALKISAIKEYEDHFAITFEEPPELSGGTGIAEGPVESLKKEIRKLQAVLDESAMAEITLGEFLSGDVAKRDALCIQGVGPLYFGELKGDSPEFTVAQLAEIEPSSLEFDISNVRLNEFKTKAEMVLRFQYDAQTFAPLSGMTLTELLEGSAEELAGLTNTGDGQAPVSADVGALKRLYGPFKHTLYPVGHDRNETTIPADGDLTIPADDESLSLAGTIDPDALALLTPGRPLVLEHEDGSGDPVSVEVTKMDRQKLYLSRRLEQDEGFTKGNLIIRGNVVLAGHGERKPEKILGSGNAMLSNQSFTLEVESVAFTADATKSSGVAAAMDVEVAGQIWEQVSTLKDSTPGDRHYAIRMTEEGYVKILFGDGEYGRRLPSGNNNIRVRFRIGSGLAGNVPVRGLEKPVNPHPLIDAVLQPLPAAGGGDMEDVASLRENAPPTLLALERAVSLSDFSHLAAAQSSVWQAKAYSKVLHGGRTENIEVVIVPAGGVKSDDIEDGIEDFLQTHAPPGVQVSVDDCKRVLFDATVTVRVKTDEFIADEVVKAVISALVDHFTLKNRKLGENLYLSEVYKVVEGVQGVENSICMLNDTKALQVIKAGNEHTVIYLDTDAVKNENPSTLTVTHEKYEP
ncbi:MAG: hypothetical protein OER85_09715 [Gammaproteobacteria bacterium]|nr:hypothetical protein [Gammaproteobacteria bacterium]